MGKAGQHVLSTLRQMILSGELNAGERIAEIPTADKLGVSRMPIRIAFRTLEQEGLLVKLHRRGYHVREFKQEDISGAVEVRGVLEGLAALKAAEKGLTEQHKAELIECLHIGDQLFSKGYLSEDDLDIYHDMNKRFHTIIVEASANPSIAAALNKESHRPFASISALAVDHNHLDREYHRFNYAHMQHHAIVDAISSGQGARAEALMREHANATLRYTNYFDQEPKTESNIRILSS